MGKSDAKPWEQRPDETAKAFEAFCLYRDMAPAERSQANLVKRYGKSARSVDVWSRRHAWVKRCEAWDGEQDRLAREAQLAQIVEMRKRHATLGADLLEKAAAALSALTAEEIRPADLSRMVEIGSKLERISRGDVGEVIESRDGGEALDVVQFYMPSNHRDDDEDM
ncbi:MAG: hypothetical protein Q4C56_06880 [Peptococcaceae bacterium]|nr:hypothetical protein [Peptococcaceae bacterium]